MNLIYRTLWNVKTGTFVAVSENARSAGKRAGARRGALAHRSGFGLNALAVSFMLCFGTTSYALPTGGVVAAGAAGIASTASTTTITQSTQNAAINWQSFGIAAGQTVQFLQPNSSAVALNRVLGANPSAIFGNLSANGQVFLVNPNGILFGSGASVNVGGLVASTLNITDANFMNGKYTFSNPGSGTVVNQGAIHADGGYVALLGSNVNNLGTISARMGTVALAAGSGVTLDLAGDKLLNVKVDQGAVNALVENGGLIQADGGMVLMTTQGAGSLLDTVVNNTGLIRAQTLSNVNGTIRLLGDMQSGTVNVGGTLDASGRDTGQTGGSVTATAHHVGLFGGRIDASGDAGGGSVLVGGGFQGNNPSVQNASATYMSADETVSADAISRGNGGTAVLWSNDTTRAYGTVTARGGAQSGNGGLIETSGHWLDVTGIQINASATNGKNGTWLLDPADVTITSGTTGGSFSGGNPNVFAPAAGVGSSTVDVAALRTALETAGGTDVTITTTNTGAPGIPASGMGNITVASALTWTPVASSTLTLIAAGDVNIDAPISGTRANLVVCCGRDINVRAAITIDQAAGVGGLAGGSILMSAGRDVRIERTIANPNTAISVTSGNIEICAARDVILSNTFNPGLAPLMTLTNGTTNAGLSLASQGVPLGLTLRAGNGATGPGVAGGTVNFVNGGLGGTYITTTAGGPGTPIKIVYNPISYLTPTDYSGDFTGTGGPVSASMLVYPAGADKVFDGTTAATFTSLKSDALGNAPAGVTLAGTGTFDSAAVGVGKIITYSGLTLGGASATTFALPADCCGATKGTGRTTGNISALILPIVVPPVVVVPPAVVVPPIVVAPPVVVTPPGVAAPPVVGAPAVAGVSSVVPPFLAPLVLVPVAGTPVFVATVLSPPSTVLVEVPSEAPPETLVAAPPVVAKSAELPYTVPVRPAKQGRQ